MGIIRQKNNISIADRVAAAADTLRASEAANKDAADDLIRQAAIARDEADRAGKQALATEKALSILDEAGVTL